MSSPRKRGRRRFFVPEVVQTSAMDCGPAALECLLQGYGIDVSYGRLREACQTDVDGTSIDTLQSVAVELGLDAEQVLVPLEQLEACGPEIQPAIVVVRTPGGANHFTLLWRSFGPLLQLMDPAAGRTWSTRQALRRSVYVHESEVEADTWFAWAKSEPFLSGLRGRLRRLGIGPEGACALIDGAIAEGRWRPLAALDALARMARAMQRAKALRRGVGTARFCRELFAEVREERGSQGSRVPATYWDVRPVSGPGEPERLAVRGAVAVRVRGRATARTSIASPAAGDGTERRRDLERALRAPRSRIGRTLWRSLWEGGGLGPSAGLAALGVATLAVMLQALVFRGLFDLGAELALGTQRLAAAAALAVFLLAVLLVEIPLAWLLTGLGRQLEGRLRRTFHETLPRIADRYFRSRPASDMAERAHSLVLLRSLPPLAGRILRLTLQLVLTAAGLVWLDPSVVLAAVVAAVSSIGLPLVLHPLARERELRVRSHRGALARFYLDSLLGGVPVRTHGAERALRREHESLLVEWVRASRRLLSLSVAASAVQALAGFGVAAWLVVAHLEGTGAASTTLLFCYWALSLPALGEELASLVSQLPALRNATARAVEPLEAAEEPCAGTPTAPAPVVPFGEPDEESDGAAPRIASALRAAGSASLHPIEAPRPTRPWGEGAAGPSAAEADGGVEVTMRGLSVVAGGHILIEGVDLSLREGEHVAIVGRSGAGKSTLLGLLLGWHAPATGSLAVDGAALDAPALERLRARTAWVDPAVEIWNRSLSENVAYGSESPGSEFGEALARSELLDLLETLPRGAASRLGHGGGAVSGGEGQRIRFARAWQRPGTRLAVLDEPFRGLERSRRRSLLARARHRWADATLLCVTHDLEETLAFPRVLVIESGRLVEDGSPEELARREGSAFAGMLAAERALHEEVWDAPDWVRWRVEGGRLSVDPGAPGVPGDAGGGGTNEGDGA